MKNGKQLPLEDVCNVEYGTRVVQKRDGGSVYPVYGGGGATFKMDEFNREDRLIIARFGMSEECTRFVAGRFFLNDSGLTISPKNGAMPQRFLDYQMLSLNNDIYALGKGRHRRISMFPLFGPYLFLFRVTLKTSSGSSTSSTKRLRESPRPKPMAKKPPKRQGSLRKPPPIRVHPARRGLDGKIARRGLRPSEWICFQVGRLY
jgi:hypothetical protein